jgi:thioredoxin reductase (NADPH)
VVGLRRGEDGHYRIGLSEGGEIVARSVIVGTGARYRRLGVARLGRFEGVSVHYAATEAEALRLQGEEVAVVGGGNSAGQAALYLAGRTHRVYLLIRGAALKKSMSRYLVKRVTESENVELLANTEVRELAGEDHLEGIVVEDGRSGARRTLGALSLFAFIGAEANTGWLRGAIELDERGFVLTGGALDRSVLDPNLWRNLSREPYPWRRAFRACSRRATCVPVRSSGWPPRWVRALWRSGWSISTWTTMAECTAREDSAPHC